MKIINKTHCTKTETIFIATIFLREKNIESKLLSAIHREYKYLNLLLSIQ